jgi:hypothetical protein
MEMDLPFPKLAQGSEHLVFLDADQARVWKATKLGLFGENYFLRDGKVNQKNCSPLEYLVRLRLWTGVFGSAPVAFGITKGGQILSRQPFIKGDRPTQAAVDDFLRREGFQPVKQECWLWEKLSFAENLTVGLGDARFDNFVSTRKGIVPIDVRLWATHLH